MVLLKGERLSSDIKSAELLVTYEYDPWGKLLGVKDADGSAITSSGHAAIKNPLRYRGYYYDIDSCFYYLQSRYYDPQIGRFINADEQIPTNDLSSLSLFAYCGNDPVNRLDPKGDAWWHWAVAAVAVVALVAASVVTCGGAAAAAGTAAAIVMGSCTAVPTSAAIITGAAVGASAAFAGSAAAAAASSKSLDEFAEQGEAALATTTIGAIGGAVAGYANSVTYCFVAGTPVVAESGDVPIEQINVGDFVWAWDEASGDVALKRVVETYVNETDELTHVFVDGEEIIATPSHPFYCPTKGWTDASHLRAGDILVLVNGEYVVVEKVQHELLERPVKVYNFQVEDYHTYYVASGVLVHNSCKQQLVAGNKSSWNARVSVNGMNDHNPPHAHIFYKSQKMASVTAEGKYLAESFGKMKEGRRFVKENLATIIKGIRTWWE